MARESDSVRGEVESHNRTSRHIFISLTLAVTSFLGLVAFQNCSPSEITDVSSGASLPRTNPTNPVSSPPAPPPAPAPAPPPATGVSPTPTPTPPQNGNPLITSVDTEGFNLLGRFGTNRMVIQGSFPGVSIGSQVIVRVYTDVLSKQWECDARPDPNSQGYGGLFSDVLGQVVSPTRISVDIGSRSYPRTCQFYVMYPNSSTISNRFDHEIRANTNGNVVPARVNPGYGSTIEQNLATSGVLVHRTALYVESPAVSGSAVYVDVYGDFPAFNSDRAFFASGPDGESPNYYWGVTAESVNQGYYRVVSSQGSPLVLTDPCFAYPAYEHKELSGSFLKLMFLNAPQLHSGHQCHIRLQRQGIPGLDSNSFAVKF